MLLGREGPAFNPLTRREPWLTKYWHPLSIGILQAALPRVLIHQALPVLRYPVSHCRLARSRRAEVFL